MSSLNQEIDRQAAEWAAKQDLGELSPEDEARFELWLTADIRHLGAYGRAEAVLARLDRVRGVAMDGSGVSAEMAKSRWTRRRVVLGGGIAASMAAGIFGADLWMQTRQEAYTTGIGQVREVLLADGSVITLNTSSSVSVKFTRELREVRLVQGEALFDVAKNKHRPFVVFVGDTQVRAVGTSFTVSMLPQKPIQVLVREGVVEVKRSDAAVARIRVTANTEVLAPVNAPIRTEALPTAKLTRNLAWQYGRIAFDNQTLAEAAHEFTRYSDIRIVVDPGVANKTVTGLFVSNDPIGFARAAAAVLKLQCEIGQREVRLIGVSEVRP